MLETDQSVEVEDANVTACLDVPCRGDIPGIEFAHALEKAGLSEPGFHQQFHSRENLLPALLRDRHAIWVRLFENEIEARCEAIEGCLEIIADVLRLLFQCLQHA